jgi:hypothetical protein
VDPIFDMDAEVRGKISCLCQGSNLIHPVIQSAILTEVPQLLENRMLRRILGPERD